MTWCSEEKETQREHVAVCAVLDRPTKKIGHDPTQVFRSSTEVAVTAYEPKRCETLRAVLPIRGARGISVWIRWEVEMATIRRKRELVRRLGEVQKVRWLSKIPCTLPRLGCAVAPTLLKQKLSEQLG